MTKLIKNWHELAKLEPSATHRVEIDLEFYNGHIFSLETDECVEYLSTHTFYGRSGTPHILKEYGWDVELDNWDKDRVDM